MRHHFAIKVDVPLGHSGDVFELHITMYCIQEFNRIMEKQGKRGGSARGSELCISYCSVECGSIGIP
jgi:hypothetical protein